MLRILWLLFLRGVGAEVCHRAFPARQTMRSLVGMLYPVLSAAFVSVCIAGCSWSSKKAPYFPVLFSAEMRHWLWFFQQRLIRFFSRVLLFDAEV